jgi:hypothetical protein
VHRLRVIAWHFLGWCPGPESNRHDLAVGGF